MVVNKTGHSDVDNESMPGVERNLTLSRHFFHEERIVLLSPVSKIALCGLTHFSTWSKRRILRLIVVNFLSEHKNCFWHEQLIKFMLVKRQHHAKNSSFRTKASIISELYSIKNIFSTIESAMQCGLCNSKITTNQAWSLFAWMIAWPHIYAWTCSWMIAWSYALVRFWRCWHSSSNQLLVNYFGDVDYLSTHYLAITNTKSVGGDCFLLPHHPTDEFTCEQPGNCPTFDLDSYFHHFYFFHWYFYYCCWFVIFQILSAITITMSVGGDCLVLPHHPTDLLMRFYPRVDIKRSPSGLWAQQTTLW